MIISVLDFLACLLRRSGFGEARPGRREDGKLILELKLIITAFPAYL